MKKKNGWPPKKSACINILDCANKGSEKKKEFEGTFGYNVTQILTSPMEQLVARVR